MQDHESKQGEDRVSSGHMLVRRLPLIFAGYFVAVFLAGAVYPVIFTLTGIISQFYGDGSHVETTFTLRRLLPFALFGMAFAVPTTIAQFAISVTIAEIKQIRSRLYYIVTGMLTGLTAPVLLHGSLEALLIPGVIFAFFGACLGYVYWLIAVKGEEYGLMHEYAGRTFVVIYKYALSVYIAIAVSSAIGVAFQQIANTNHNKLHESVLAIALAVLMAAPYAIVGVFFAAIPLFIFIYISNKFGLKSVWHYIAAGVIISIAIYYPNLFSYRPPFPNSLDEISAVYLARLLQSLIAGTVGGYAFWRFSKAE